MKKLEEKGVRINSDVMTMDEAVREVEMLMRKKI